MQTYVDTSSSIPSQDSNTTAIKLCNLPPFSAAAAKLIQLSELPSVDMRTIQSIVASDPSLAAELLRLANSPLFAFASEIRSVEHAVVLLGLQQVKALAVAIAMKSYWSGVDQAAYHQCWSHSIASAVIAEELAVSFGTRKEDAYTGGLLHDIGRLGLLKAYSHEYLPLLSATYENLAEGLAEEQRSLKVDHCQSGLWLMRAWAFPLSLQEIAEHHHTEADSEEMSLANLIRIACMLADTMGHPELKCHQVISADDASRVLKDSVAHRFATRIGSIEKRIIDRINYFRV